MANNPQDGLTGVVAAVREVSDPAMCQRIYERMLEVCERLERYERTLAPTCAHVPAAAPGAGPAAMGKPPVPGPLAPAAAPPVERLLAAVPPGRGGPFQNGDLDLDFLRKGPRIIPRPTRSKVGRKYYFQVAEAAGGAVPQPPARPPAPGRPR